MISTLALKKERPMKQYQLASLVCTVLLLVAFFRAARLPLLQFKMLFTSRFCTSIDFILCSSNTLLLKPVEDEVPLQLNVRKRHLNKTVPVDTAMIEFWINTSLQISSETEQQVSMLMRNNELLVKTLN